MRFSDVLSQALARPVLGLTVLLVLAVILVNGWTDAPNAIATVVTTGGSPSGGRWPWRRCAICWACAA